MASGVKAADGHLFFCFFFTLPPPSRLFKVPERTGQLTVGPAPPPPPLVLLLRLLLPDVGLFFFVVVIFIVIIALVFV